jgi:hypothetical protein
LLVDGGLDGDRRGANATGSLCHAGIILAFGKVYEKLSMPQAPTRIQRSNICQALSKQTPVPVVAGRKARLG